MKKEPGIHVQLSNRFTGEIFSYWGVEFFIVLKYKYSIRMGKDWTWRSRFLWKLEWVDLDDGEMK